MIPFGEFFPACLKDQAPGNRRERFQGRSAEESDRPLTGDRKRRRRVRELKVLRLDNRFATYSPADPRPPPRIRIRVLQTARREDIEVESARCGRRV